MTTSYSDLGQIEIPCTAHKCYKYINEATNEFLSYGARVVECLKEALVEDPNCFYANSMLASYFCLLADIESAKKYYKIANDNVKNEAKKQKVTAFENFQGYTDRERAYLGVLENLIAGDIENALNICVNIVTKYPRSLWIAKLGTILAFYTGNKEKMLSISKMILKNNEENHYVYGILGFSLQEIGKFEQAKKICQKGLKLVKENDKDPWLEHALAHVLYHKGDIQESLYLLKQASFHWAHCNSFMYTHNWWHLALCYLDVGAPAEYLLRIFDEHIWVKDKYYNQDQINAISLLLRLDLRKIDLGNRLEDVVKYISLQNSWHKDLQNDLLISYALTISKSEIFYEFLESAKNHAMNSKRSKLLNEVYLPCIFGLHFFAKKNWKLCCENLKNSCMRVPEFGASLDQATVFIEVYIYSLIMLRKYSDAVEMIKKHFSDRFCKVPFYLGQLHFCYSSLKNKEELLTVQSMLDGLNYSW